MRKPGQERVTSTLIVCVTVHSIERKFLKKTNFLCVWVQRTVAAVFCGCEALLVLLLSICAGHAPSIPLVHLGPVGLVCAFRPGFHSVEVVTACFVALLRDAFHHADASFSIMLCSPQLNAEAR